MDTFEHDSTAVSKPAVWADFTAGWFAGAAGLLLGHPLDTIKVRMQTNSRGGFIHCIRNTVRNESVFGLYKGMAAPLVATGLLHSFQFAGYGSVLKLLGHEHQADYEIPMTHVIIASNVGTICQWWLSCPIDVVKIKLQVQQENLSHLWNKQASAKNQKMFATSSFVLYTGPLDCAIKTVRRDGPLGLYRAGPVMLLRDMLGFNFYIPVYEFLLRKFKGDKDQYKVAATMIAGGVAGVTGWVSILPLDVVKSRLQASRALANAKSGSAPKLNALDCARQIYATEGAGAFFRGFTALCVRSFPCNAVLFLVYQQLIDGFNLWHAQS